MLLTDGFGGFGGISRFNRDFLNALDASTAVDHVKAIPRLISDPIEEIIPESVIYDRKAAKGKNAFVWRALVHAWRDSGIDLVICGHINLLPVAYLVAKRHHARLVLIIHGVDAWQPTRNPFTNRLSRLVNGFIAVSQFSADRFVKWSKLPAGRCTILPNCVDLERFVPGPRDSNLADRYGLNGAKVIMTLGRLAPRERYKGFDETIDVIPALVSRYPNLKYLIVGDGEDRARLKAKAHALGVAGNIVFTGRIVEAEKVAHYSLADAYVMPSSGEGFGIVLIEAAACGLAVIGSRADGSREALLNGRLGRLVDPRNQSGLVEEISRVLDADAPRRRPEGIETFSVENFRARLDKWLQAQAGACLPLRDAA